MPDQQTISSFGEMLRMAIGDAINAASGTSFLAMCAEDIVFQFPFAPAGSVTEVRGKSNLTRYLSKVGCLLTFDAMETPVTHASTDGETDTLEFSCKGRGSKTGIRYDQNYISVIQVRNGQITKYRDYWNPLVLLKAVGGIDALTSEFQAFIYD